MKRSFHIRIVFCLAAVLILLSTFSCSGLFSSSGKGRLVIDLGSGVRSARSSSTPPQDITSITFYLSYPAIADNHDYAEALYTEWAQNHPGYYESDNPDDWPDFYKVIAVAPGSTLSANLIPGRWHIAAEAYSESLQIWYFSEQDIDIKSGKTTKATLHMEVLGGNSGNSGNSGNNTTPSATSACIGSNKYAENFSDTHYVACVDIQWNATQIGYSSMTANTTSANYPLEFYITSDINAGASPRDGDIWSPTGSYLYLRDITDNSNNSTVIARLYDASGTPQYSSAYFTITLVTKYGIRIEGSVAGTNKGCFLFTQEGLAHYNAGGYTPLGYAGAHIGSPVIIAKPTTTANILTALQNFTGN